MLQQIIINYDLHRLTTMNPTHKSLPHARGSSALTTLRRLTCFAVTLAHLIRVVFVGVGIFVFPTIV